MYKKSDFWLDTSKICLVLGATTAWPIHNFLPEASGAWSKYTGPNWLVLSPYFYLEFCIQIFIVQYRKQDMLEILKDYGKTSINPKEVAQVFGMWKKIVLLTKVQWDIKPAQSFLFVWAAALNLTEGFVWGSTGVVVSIEGFIWGL